MKTLRLIPTLLLLGTTSFSQMGKDGDVIITTTQIVNESTFLSSDAVVGDLTLTVNNSGMNTLGSFGTPLAAGDLIMVIQMQGATILGNVNNITWGEIQSYNNCGVYEFKEVASVPNGTHINLICPLDNNYDESGNVQVIRVPRYNSLTVNGGTITSQTWNGQRGGIVAIEVLGLTTLINGGKIDVTGLGFRGGVLDNSAGFAALMYASNSQNDGGEKGESIAGFGPEYAFLGGRYGRGAPANGGGGGNAHNAGGGGGANAGNEFPWNGLGNPSNTNPLWTNAWDLEGGGFSTNQSSGGGRGGYSYSSANQNALVTGTTNAIWGGDTRRNIGGIGGRNLDYNTGRLFVGGGGGAGDGNNGAGTNGASGGGLVFLMTYNDVVGTGQIIASGQSAPTTPPNGNDAPGGGGGGGTIVIAANGTISSTISLIANGGDGGDQFILTNEAEGPGGGGGGGYIAFSTGTPSTNVLGGANGTTNSLSMTEFTPNGATVGGSGMISPSFMSNFNIHITAMNDSICSGTSTTLDASASNPVYTSSIQWFDAPYGNLLGTGSTFTTPNLFATTTYYLKVCPSLSIDSVLVYVENVPVFGVTPDSTTCFAGTDGSAQANGFLPDYSYLWSNGQTGPFATNFAAGNYSVTASTSLGCSTIVNFIIAQPNQMTVIFNGSPALCFNQASGSLQAFANGGTAPYNYQWTSPAVSGNIITNVLAGNYTVNVVDDNGCTISANGSVTNPLPLIANVTAITDVNCNGGNDGSAQVGIAGGTAPYSIDWLALAFDSTFVNNLTAGNYIAEIMDANSCMATVVATISEPLPFSVDLVVISDETCSNGNGSAFASISGGIGILNYVWTPNVSTTNLATNLSAGLVQVTVTDEHGCISSDNETLMNYATGSAVIASLNPVSCANGSNGSVTVDMIGGTAPFNYFWSCVCPNSNTANNLSAGNYSVNITDHYGCIEILNVVINELPTLVLDTVTVTEPLCFGDANGSAQVQATGGTAPFFFSWNTMPAQYNSLATNLSAGTYSATVTDANNCQTSSTIILGQPAEITIQTTVLSNVLCFGDSAGVAVAEAFGGIQPYQFSWSNMTTNDTISNLQGGAYLVNVTDANNCQATGAAEIMEYQFVTAEIIADSVFCPGDLVYFYVATNGMNNLYDYEWSVNGNLQSTQNSYTIPIYTETEISIELVHQVNCPSIYDTITVSPIKLDPAILDVTGTTDTICLGSSGMVVATISDWSYITNVYWAEQLFVGVGPFVVTPTEDHYYVITVENSCNERIEDSVKLNVFLPPSANIYAWGTDGCGEVNAEFGFDYVANDYPLTAVNWNLFYNDYSGPSPVVNFDNSIDFMANLYLTFSNGCTFDYSDTVRINVWEVPEANFYYNPDPALENESTELIDISHGNPVAWEWYVENQFVSDEERNFYTFEEQGFYNVTEIITNEFGCTDTARVVIEVIGYFTVYVPNAFTPDGNDYNNSFKPIMTNVKPDNYRFLIFNRWGEIIFEATSLDASWDGDYMGNLVEDGVYVYRILVTDNTDKEHEYNGHVTLLK